MADESVKFKFDLDAKEALVKLTELKEGLDKIGESKSVDGLISGFTKMVPNLAIAIGAIMAFKAALDLTLQGEALEKVNRQFDILAKQAGLSSDVLREGIEKSLGGMSDLDDALKAANTAIVKLGVNAEKIPQVFELARKVSSVFGGDLTSNFEAITQAIAAGNMRMLKHMGIIIDADKAYSNYAKSIGTTAGALSQVEKQAALMNSVLSYGKDKFSNIAEPTETVTAQLQKLKIAAKEASDSFALFFTQTGVTSTIFKTLTTLFSSFSSVVKENFGTPLDAASTKMNRLNAELLSLQQGLTRAKSGEDMGFISRLFGGPDIEYMEKKIAALKVSIGEIKAEKSKLESEAPKTEKETIAPKAVDLEAQKLRLEQHNKFEKELLSLTASRIKSQQDIETDFVEFNTLLNEQRLTIEQQYQAKIEELTLKGKENKEITVTQANEMILQLEAEKNAKLKSFDEQRQEETLKAFDNQLKAANSFSEGWVSSSHKAAWEAQKDLTDYGKKGQIAFNAISSGAVTFFRGLGAGAADAGALMRGFMFGALGDIADGFGQMYLKAGIAAMSAGSPGGAIQVAEGGALISLGAMLKAQGGGGGGGSLGGGGGGGSVGGPVEPGGSVAPVAQETAKKTVTVNFLGDYLSTEQTQKRLVELIRQETDATDYKYQQIGVR